MTKEEALLKAAMTTADITGSTKGGKMLPKQFDKFIRMVMDKPTMLADMRKVTMDRDSMLLEKLGFANRILRAGVEATPLAAADRAVPTTGKIELNSKEVVAELNLSYDVLLENIERDSLYDTVMQMAADRIAVDLEELAINGMTTATDPYMALFDGVLEKTKATNLYDAQGTGVDPATMMKLRMLVPSKYQRSISDYCYYASPNIALNYVKVIGDRETLLGDAQHQNKVLVPTAYGIPIKSTALIHEDKTYGTHNNCTDIVYCNPKNLIWGIQKDITIETDRDIRAGVFIIVIRSRIAFNIEEPDAISRATNVLPQF